jgi:hypothetical protein
VMERLEAADRAAAQALLDECCSLYAPVHGDDGASWKVSQD